MKTPLIILYFYFYSDQNQNTEFGVPLLQESRISKYGYILFIILIFYNIDNKKNEKVFFIRESYTVFIVPLLLFEDFRLSQDFSRVKTPIEGSESLSQFPTLRSSESLPNSTFPFPLDLRPGDDGVQLKHT